MLGNEIGFSDNILDSFQFLKQIYTRRGHMEMAAAIVNYKEGNSIQIHTHGHASLVVDKCSEYWDGNNWIVQIIIH